MPRDFQFRALTTARVTCGPRQFTERTRAADYAKIMRLVREQDPTLAGVSG